MAKLMDDVNQRTQLVGQNRLELLLFRLGDGQNFAINVFKVREAINCPDITPLPNTHPVVRGVSYLRELPIPIIDLGRVLGRSVELDPAKAYVVVTEFNRSVQGFLVHSVDRIINMNWEDILPPPRGMDTDTYMTAVTYADDELIQILDVEKILSDVLGDAARVSDQIKDGLPEYIERLPPILVADDSTVARSQVKKSLAEVGLDVIMVSDGRKALEQLQRWADDGPVNERISMVLSDIEMPQMDGYTLCAQIRKDDRLEHLFVMMHSSLSGVFNETMVRQAGADDFLPKFSTDELSARVLEHIDKLVESGLVKV
jgi:two-component system chemotaxis response regulator CheV